MPEDIKPVTVHKARQSKNGYMILVLPELPYGIMKETQEQSELSDAQAILAALKDSISYSVFFKLQELMEKEAKI